MKKILLISMFCLFILSNIHGQVPANYYDSAIGLTGDDLKQELKDITTNGHSPISYNAVWSAFGKTDVYPAPDNTTIWDMYSDVPGGTAAYYYTLSDDQCGTFSAEGDCYNREHSFPKSWWGGSKDKNDDEGDPTKYSTQYTDLNQLVASDGYVNGMRDSYAYGDVESTSWSSTNGSKLGTNTSVYGSSWTVFEPIDEYKGDFARALFYMATRYDVASWVQDNSSTDIVYVFNNDGSFRNEYYAMIYQWHQDDPVSQKELDRNDEVYNKQHNANPYINHPEWVCEVFGACPILPEPDNYPTGFAATAVGSSQIDLSWTDATGSNLPEFYLLKASTANSFSDPADGTDPNEDTDLSDGSALVKVAHASGAAYSFAGLSASTTYYFKIWSYTNSGTDIDFKTSPSAPVANATTGATGSTTCEDFDTGLASSYTTGDVSLSSGTWHLNQVYKEAASASHGGSGAAARINDDKAGAHLRSPALNSLGNVSFWYRELNSGGGTFVLQKSYDNSSWTNITSQSYSGTSYTQFSYDVNDGNNPVYIRILSDNNPGHLIIDDFCWTIFSSSSNSAESDIVRSTSFTEPENIPYINYQATDIQNAGNDIEVARFRIRDGAAGNDSDSEPTTLSDISFSLTQAADVRRIAIYDGTTELAETEAASTVSFSGLSLTAADDGSKDFSIRMSFQTAITDQDQFQLTIVSATAHSSGSNFATSNAGGASTDMSADRNRLNVVADRLVINVPASASRNTNFDVSLTAKDALGNMDVNETTAVTLSLASGSGTLSAASGLNRNLTAGMTTWNDVQYDVAEDIMIEGQSSSLQNVTSDPLSITSNGTLFISEVADTKDNYKYRFVEIYNASASAIDLAAGNYYLTKQSNGGSYVDIAMSGTVAAHAAFVIAYNATEFQNAYGFAPDQSSGNISGNGDDAYFLYQNGDHSTGNLLDIYGVENEDGSGKNWEYLDGHAVRKRNIDWPATTWDAGEWSITSAASGTGSGSGQMTPGRHKTNLQWTGNTSTDWNLASNWDTQYVPDASDLAIIASSSNHPEITEDAMVYRLTIVPGMHLTEGENLHFEMGEKVILQSDASASAGFIGFGSVEADIETFISAEEWHMLAPPVQNDDSGTFTGVYLKEYNESDSSWTYINPTNIALENGKSYFVWSPASMGDFTATHQGTILTADRTIDLDYTNPHPHPGGMGWNMIGNPYSSGLLFNSDWNIQNAGQTIYAWDQSSGNYKSVNTSGIGSMDSIVSMAQGFWIRATASGASLTIPRDNRCHTSNVFMKKEMPNSDNEYHFILSGNNHSDEVVIAFREDATDGFDSKYDAYKLAGKNVAPQLYCVQDGLRMSMNVLAVKQTLDLFAGVGEDGIYTLRMSEPLPQESVWIEDVENGVITKISESNYSFFASQADAPKALKVYFSHPASDIENSKRDYQIIANRHRLIISSPQAVDAVIYVYSLNGQLLKQEKMQGDECHFSLKTATSCVFVKIVDKNEVFIQKIILW